MSPASSPLPLSMLHRILAIFRPQPAPRAWPGAAVPAPRAWPGAAAPAPRAWLGTMVPALLLVLALAGGARAQEPPLIVLDSPNRDPLPIAVTDLFGGGDTELDRVGRDIRGVIANNLSGSGLIRVIDQGAYLQGPADLQATPRFADWRLIDAQGLVTGAVRREGDQLRVEFRLWNVFTGSQIEGQAYVTTPDNWRRIAHIISDAIYKALTGEDGYFDTRIVYIAESGPYSSRTKRLAIMDQDGANHKFLTDGNAYLVNPRFSPTRQDITYMAYTRPGDPPAVYVLNIDTGRQLALGNFTGMSFAPRFSPDGNSVIFSLMDPSGTNSDIYAVDLRTRAQRRLTDSPALNTSPSYSPDGRQIVFQSNRGGSSQLYVMDANGGQAQRISFGSGQYFTPVWSPRGDLIAFTKQRGGAFFIGVMRPDGSGEQDNLATGYLVEGPTWAPNGRVLMYFQEEPVQGGRDREARLYAIDLTRINKRLVPTPGNASDPAWSPLLQ